MPRTKLFAVTPELLLSLGQGTYKVVKNEIPSDVKVLGGSLGREYQGAEAMPFIYLELEHESFEDHDKESPPPIEAPTIIKIDPLSFAPTHNFKQFLETQFTSIENLDSGVHIHDSDEMVEILRAWELFKLGFGTNGKIS